jgi:hypothetical protein
MTMHVAAAVAVHDHVDIDDQVRDYVGPVGC